MSNLDDTTTGTGEYLNDDALDFRMKTELDRRQAEMSNRPSRHCVLISIESLSMGGIAQALAEIGNKISGGIPAGTKREAEVSYTFNRRVT